MKGICTAATWESGKQGAWAGLSFTQYLEAIGFNKSLLALLDELAGGCPAKFRRGLSEKDTPSMAWGRAVHGFALEGVKEWVVTPYDSFRTNEAKEWRAAQTLPVVTADEEREIVATAAALRRHPHAWPLMKHGRREVSMFANYGPNNTLLKCRPDILQPTWMLDLKTAADASTHSFSRTLARYAYDLQAAICWKCHAILFGTAPDYYLIAIERGDPPLFNVRKLSATTLQAAQTRLDMLLLKIAECEASGVWPDYTGLEVGEIEAPAWTMPDEIEIDLAM